MTTKRRLRRGLLIVFEGLDGAGKTTQVRLLHGSLRQAGYAVVALKEPTDGPWGQKIRQLAVHGRHQISPETELCWFLQDRRDDVAHNIRPALESGHLVLLDRYYFSTMAYQGALGLDPQHIQACNEAFAPMPDLLLLLELPPPEGLQRVQQRGNVNHFERLEYLERVAAIFHGMTFPYLRRVPATHTPQEVQACIWREVLPLLEQYTSAADPTGQEEAQR